EMAAYLLFGDVPTKVVRERALLTALKEEGVLKGIDRPSVQGALGSWQPNSAVRVATGTLPMEGEDAYLLEVFADSGQAGLAQDDGDSASDFCRTRLAEPVPTGQVIVMKSPATSGYEGVTVLGTPIVPEAGEDFDLTQFAGEGVTASDDGNALVA